MKVPTAKLGYVAAGATVFAAVLVPFLLMGTFSKAFAGFGLHVDELYSGGPKVRSIQRNGYWIDVHRPVYPHMLQGEASFIQVAWRPASALPAHISDTVDLNNDGQPDIRATFDVPRDPKAVLHVEVEPLNPSYGALHHVEKESFSRLIVRVDDAILVRVPLRK